MGKSITALAAILFTGFALAQPIRDVQKVTQALSYQDGKGGSLPYRQYVTPGLEPKAKIPLVLFLHGAGERGSDNRSQLRHGIGQIIRYSRERKVPLALIVPQCPAGKQWVDTPWNRLSHRMNKTPSGPMSRVMALVKERCSSLPIDTGRIYVTGISMGGYGTWDYLQRDPDLFAAAVPICGGGDTTLAGKLRDIPIWTFHGSADKAVPVQRSRTMVSALKACRGKIRYREYPGAGHNVWTRTYGDSEVLDWLFSQKKK